MAAPVKERRNVPYTRQYDGDRRQSSRYEYKSSNAYDYIKTYPEIPAVPLKKRTPVPERERRAEFTKSPAAVKRMAWKISKRKFAGSVLKIAAVFLVGCTLVYRNAMILESNQKISKMQSQYETILSQNQAIATKIEQSVEIGALEEKATEELGMMKPDASQVFYVDMEMGDGVENAEKGNAASSSGSALKGAPGALVHAFQVLK